MPRPKAIDKAYPVTARIPESVIGVLRRIARREERTVSQVASRLLRQKLEELGELPERQD